MFMGQRFPQEAEGDRYTLLCSSPDREGMLYMVVRWPLRRWSRGSQQLWFMQVVTGLKTCLLIAPPQPHSPLPIFLLLGVACPNKANT